MDRRVWQLFGLIGGGAILLTGAMKYSNTVPGPAATTVAPVYSQEMSATISAACQNEGKLCQAYSKIVVECEMAATHARYFGYNWASRDKLPFGDGVWAHGDARALFDLETGALCIYDLQKDRVVWISTDDRKESVKNRRPPQPEDYRDYDNVRVACQSEAISKFASSGVTLKWDNPPFGSARWHYPDGILVDKEANAVCWTNLGSPVSVAIWTDVDVLGLIADTDEILRQQR